jgi:acyl-CoA thioester hydrolase
MNETQVYKMAVELLVPFCDVDAMEVVWHGHYAKYFEAARVALLEQINYNYPQMKASGYAWPVIDMHIRYIQAIRFNQMIRVHAHIVEWEYRLKINYFIEDALTHQKLTKGHTIQVAVKIDSGALNYMSPAILLQKLGVKTT